MGPVRNVVLAAAVTALVAVGCSDEAAAGYDDAFQADFETACQSAVSGESAAVACRCWYERLSAEVPFAELPSLDDLTGSDPLDEAVDPELYERLADCALAFGAVAGVEVTAPPPVTVPRPTTTTTVLIAEG